MKKNITIILMVLLLFFQWGQPLTYANEQNDIEEKVQEAGGNEVDNKSEVEDHEEIDSNRHLTNFNTSEFEIQPNSTGVTIIKYLGAGGPVIIPEIIGGKPVTIIGNLAFYDSKLTEIVIPESVITIGDWAFADNLLSTVVIPDSVTDIGRWTFHNNKLTSVAISKSITTIGYQAFYGNQLVHVDIPDGVTDIEHQAFFGNQITTVNIPDSVTKIGTRAFTSNRITNIKIPNSVTSIGDEAFAYNQLINVELPNSISSIGNNVFESNKITTVNIPNSVTSIGKGAFQANYLTNIELPNSLLSIGNLAFYNNQLKSIVIPNNVTSIGDWAFGQNRLTSIELPDSLLSIGNLAFNDNQLSNVSFPNSLKSIGDRAFEFNRLQWVQFNSPLMSGANTFISQGVTFEGWYQDLSWVTQWDGNVTQPLRIYAKGNVQQYTVTFETNTDTTLEVQKVLAGEKAVVPDAPVKAGFTFGGWYKDEELNIPWSFDTDVITENIILYAKWEKVARQYTLDFETNGGSAVASQKVTDNTMATKPADPTKAGHEFVGWYTDTVFSTPWNFTTDTVTKNTTLYAKWEKVFTQYTLDFETNGGSTVASQKVTEDTLATKPADPTKAGYEFAGWYMDPAFSTPWNFTTDKVTENTTLYAKWEKVATQYTLDFETNGGSTVVSQKVTEDTLAIKPANPIKAGYEFAGWYMDPTFTTPWNFTTDKITQNTTLYAKWENAVAQYTVDFETNGGSAVASQTVTKDTLATKPVNPTKAGYIFTGWYKDINLTIPWDFSKDVVKANLTLYAHWVTGGSTGGGGSISPNPAPIPEPTIPIKPQPKPEEPTDPQPTESAPQQESDIIFSDISQEHWAWTMIQEMARQGIITGYQDGSFKPNAPIQRQHVALMLTRALELEPKKEAFIFEDIPESHLYFEEIKQVQQAGLFDGIDGNFQPKSNMTRSQMAKVLVEALNLTAHKKKTFNDVSAAHWAYNYIAILASNGITIGDQGNFRPNDPVTRAEFAIFLYRALSQ
ncbi:InlB B-repeat-containing protein [Lysinibacillus capsici]|uniref:InlB B-repeat-containing protein n=1 Tax=Lysinibacillus capsici TaxID=2115968 RepID=UPI0028EA36DD|nr:InlB B-repeat-containing protein [Lysinibacillus capsici]MED4555314.1 InlB B-repeat-containing protein [Lysinibacillus capsici]